MMLLTTKPCLQPLDRIPKPSYQGPLSRHLLLLRLTTNKGPAIKVLSSIKHNPLAAALTNLSNQS